MNRYFKENNIEYEYAITTNGSLLTPNNIQFLLENKFNFFQITIDGSKENYNKNRPTIDGKGTWDLIFRNLKNLKAHNDKQFTVYLRVNYNYEVIENIDELLKKVTLELDERFLIFFHSIGKWGEKNDENLDVVDYRLEPFALKFLVEKKIQYGLDPIANCSIFFPYEGVCYASKPYSFTLGIDGKLRKCNEENSIKDKFNIVGTIENGRIEIDRAKLAKFILPNGTYSLKEKCNNCEFLPLCCGQGCPVNRLETGKDSCHSAFTILDDLLYLRIKYLMRKEENEKEKIEASKI